MDTAGAEAQAREIADVSWSERSRAGSAWRTTSSGASWSMGLHEIHESCIKFSIYPPSALSNLYDVYWCFLFSYCASSAGHNLDQ